MQHKQGNIPYTLDVWADPVVQFLLLKSSMVEPVIHGRKKDLKYPQKVLFFELNAHVAGEVSNWRLPACFYNDHLLMLAVNGFLIVLLPQNLKFLLVVTFDEASSILCPNCDNCYQIWGYLNSFRRVQLKVEMVKLG